MTNTPTLILASTEQIAEALSFGLRYGGCKRVHGADQAMGCRTTDRLVQRLAASGLVLMNGVSTPAPTTAVMPPSVRLKIARSAIGIDDTSKLMFRPNPQWWVVAT